MPIKRRAVKGRKHKITDEARAIWASGRKELICLTTGGAGMVADEALADALGLPPFVVFLIWPTWPHNFPITQTFLMETKTMLDLQKLEHEIIADHERRQAAIKTRRDQLVIMDYPMEAFQFSIVC